MLRPRAFKEIILIEGKAVLGCVDAIVCEDITAVTTECGQFVL